MRKFYAIIGHPVAHSLSPAFQQAAFDARNIDAAYLPFDLSSETLSRGLKALKILNVSGFNVTLPHKESLFPHMDDVSEEARQIGAINSVLFRKGNGGGSGWFGHNTDGPGFSNAFDLFCKKNRVPFPTHALVFGAGGSSRAILWALARNGTTRLCLVNRTVERARDLSDAPFLSVIPDRTAFSLSDPRWKEWLRSTPRPLLVNTLSLHAFGDAGSSFLPLDNVDLGHAGAMIDLSYAILGKPGDPTQTICEGQTPFLKMGEPYRVPRQNGLGMLLCQGVLAFELWTGEKAPFGVMEDAIARMSGQRDLWTAI
jgi:shikimate dehydrogenase